MGKVCAAALAFALLSAQALTSGARSVTEESHFQPPEAVSVRDVTIPNGSIAIGTVVLDVTISAEGEVGNVQVRRDIASESEEALRAVETWKFRPAKLDGKAVSARMMVAVTFNPAPPFAANIPLPPLAHQDDAARLPSSFEPPDVTYATFPTYPVMAVNPRTVILQASIDEAGKAQKPEALRDAPPFTSTVLQALQDWKFTAATLNDRPIASKVVLVFCFRQPITSWPY